MASTLSSAHELLGIWERGVAASPAERGDALLQTQPASLAERNAALLRARSQRFGNTQALRCNCPSCHATTEFSIDCDSLAGSLSPFTEPLLTHSLAAFGYRIDFRLPQPADVRVAAARAADRDTFVQLLLTRCICTCVDERGEACEVSRLPADVTLALSQSMEELEPGALVSFDVSCPECGTAWNARMDCADLLWSEVQSRAEQLLLDVDALARSYGWNEPEVLSLSAARRAAYLQLIGAA